jgi:hypothetical protein
LDDVVDADKSKKSQRKSMHRKDVKNASTVKGFSDKENKIIKRLCNQTTCKYCSNIDINIFKNS